MAKAFTHTHTHTRDVNAMIPDVKYCQNKKCIVCICAGRY